MENHNRMLEPWHTNDGMIKIWRHLKSCANYGFYTGEPVPNNILRNAALIVINRSRVYNQRYLDFKIESDQSFANVNRFFGAAKAERSEVMEEAGAHGYGMNAMGGVLDYDVDTRAFRESRTNLAYAVKANRYAHNIIQKNTSHME